MSIPIFEINDIIYTKDGRKSGNLTVVDINEVSFWKDHPDIKFTEYTCMSDYGNVVKTLFGSPSFKKQFYSKPGKATSTHKYYNYKQSHPEEFI